MMNTTEAYLCKIERALAAVEADNARLMDENIAYMGALTCALDWLVNKPDDMSEASVIAMIRAELGIKTEVQS